MMRWQSTWELERELDIILKDYNLASVRLKRVENGADNKLILERKKRVEDLKLKGSGTIEEIRRINGENEAYLESTGLIRHCGGG